MNILVTGNARFIGIHTPLNRHIAPLQPTLAKQAKQKLLPRQAGDVSSAFADVSAREAQLPHLPTISVEEGAAQFVSWHREYYAK